MIDYKPGDSVVCIEEQCDYGKRFGMTVGSIWRFKEPHKSNNEQNEENWYGWFKNKEVEISKCFMMNKFKRYERKEEEIKENTDISDAVKFANANETLFAKGGMIGVNNPWETIQRKDGSIVVRLKTINNFAIQVEAAEKLIKKMKLLKEMYDTGAVSRETIENEILGKEEIKQNKNIISTIPNDLNSSMIMIGGNNTKQIYSEMGNIIGKTFSERLKEKNIATEKEMYCKDKE